MFCISINHGGVVWAFMYRTEEAAKAAHSMLSLPDQFSQYANIADDYGQIGQFKRADIQGILFEDFDQSKGAHVERTIHATKVQLEAQKRMHSDPSIRSAGPAVLAPGNGLIRQ